MSIAMKLNQVFASVAGKSKPAVAKPASAPAQTEQSLTSSSPLTNTTTKHKSGKFFEDVQAKLKLEGTALVSKVNAVIGFQVNCSGQVISYVIDLKNGTGSVFVNDGSTRYS